MTLALSLYLDLVRFAAALAVVVDHVSAAPFTKDIVWWRLSHYGGIAVTVFFVLSGYVIAHVTAGCETTAREYFSSRIARLYSVVAVALPLTYLLDTLGAFMTPAVYEVQNVLWHPPSWMGYFSSALFLNEYGIFNFGGASPGSNGPYWSLSFEATYYVVAGLALFAPRRWGIPAAVILLAAAGKTIAVLLPIWMLGFGLYRAGNLVQLGMTASHCVFWASALALVAIPYFNAALASLNFGASFPFGRGPFNRNVAQDYAVALLFAAHLMAARTVLSMPRPSIERPKELLRKLGALTFPLYCIHHPALAFFAALSPWGNTTLMNFLFLGLMLGLLTLVVTPMCDSLKVWIRQSFTSKIVTLPQQGGG
jgi:peptidoglycan/LPS O-acetylase OafA/YrhL